MMLPLTISSLIVLLTLPSHAQPSDQPAVCDDLQASFNAFTGKIQNRHLRGTFVSDQFGRTPERFVGDYRLRSRLNDNGSITLFISILPVSIAAQSPSEMTLRVDRGRIVADSPGQPSSEGRVVRCDSERLEFTVSSGTGTNALISHYEYFTPRPGRLIANIRAYQANTIAFARWNHLSLIETTRH